MTDATKLLTTLLMLGMMAGNEFCEDPEDPVDFGLQDDEPEKENTPTIKQKERKR